MDAEADGPGVIDRHLAQSDEPLRRGQTVAIAFGLSVGVGAALVALLVILLFVVAAAVILGWSAVHFRGGQY